MSGFWLDWLNDTCVRLPSIVLHFFSPHSHSNTLPLSLTYIVEDSGLSNGKPYSLKRRLHTLEALPNHPNERAMSTKNLKDQTPPPAFAFSQSSLSNASETSQRRGGSSGSHGAGAVTRQGPQGRNNQPLRRQNKAHRRAQLIDDDTMANTRRGQTSITHLLNFSLPPRPHVQYHDRHRRFQRANATWGLGSGYHAADKARYVHANYRFIVKSDCEYPAQVTDADVFVEWENVLQVLASATTQSTSCPICLSDPVAARMSKCGHIFCLPCLIRYMHSTDETTPLPEKKARWKRCPICEDSIYISETRSVRWFEGQEAPLLQEGGDVLLKLVMREPGKALALPRESVSARHNHEDIPWYNVADMMDYSRFLKGGEDYMARQYDNEINELEKREKEDELMFGDDSTWSRRAISSVKDAKSKLEGLPNPPEYPPTNQQTATQLSNRNSRYRTFSDPAGPLTDSRAPADQSQTLPEAIASLQLQSTPFKGRSTIAQYRSGPQRPPNLPFFFYHTLPNFYLSPLDIRLLKAAYGDFSDFPSTLLPRVEHISTGHVVDDDLRKRAKYMAHLPYGAEVSFLECDWTDVLPERILDQHHEEIERRRKRNHDKEAREERERIRAEKMEDDIRLAAIRRRRPSLVEKSFSEADFVPLTNGSPVPGGSSEDGHSLSTSPPWGPSRIYSSFATLASPGTSPEAPRTVWGTAMVPSSSPQLVTSNPDPPTLPADDGWLQDWERDLLDQHHDSALVEAAEGSKPQSASRKKKGKKITLMSTTARRGA